MRPSILLALALLAPNASQDSATDPLILLNNVCTRYAKTSSYHIEAIKERTTMNELDRNWEKMFLTAISAPDGRYRFEARTGHGSAVLVSDGKTKWDYHLNEHLYTKAAASASDGSKRHVISMEEMGTMEAKQLVTEIRMLASNLKSARLLHDEVIELSGRNVDCYVVSFGESDFKTNKSDEKMEETIWISKSSNVVVKTHRRSDTYLIMPGSNAHIPIISEVITTYPVAELDNNEPEISFSFTAPATAKLVESFPELKPHTASENPAAELVGKPAPDVVFKAADGKLTSLSAYRGKPIFVEFWATWCAPCVDLIPGLKKLHEETAAKGLVWIGIEIDDDPVTAASFASQEHIPWPNYHDGDGSLSKAFGRQGIPLGVLIDAGGKVIFYKSGYEISDLQAALAKLDPEFNPTTLPKADSK
jgi:thiol-disulfide isomerase/thioredoxin